MRLLLVLFIFLYVLPLDAQIRLTKVDPVSREISIKNFGTGEVDITDYRLCSSLVYTTNLTTNVAIVSGDLVLSADEEVTISWDPATAFDVDGRDMGLYLPGVGGFGSAANMVDYMQYLGSFPAPEGRENVANAAGIWTPGTFVSGDAPYTYIGNGTDVGADFWTGVAPACTITALSAGAQTACEPTSNTYTQEIVVTYENPPASGSLEVNGQTFSIATSPQTVTLVGLVADGNSVNITASFTADGACTLTSNDLFTAPVNCTPQPCAITALSAGAQTACEPTSNTYTQEIVVTYENPPASGSLEVNGQTFSIGTSPQTVTLVGLMADGNSVNITASFTADGACTLTSNDLFTAPVNCTPQSCAITALSAGVQTACVPASNTYSQEVIVTFENAPTTGSLEVNGQTFAIGTSPQTVTLIDLPADGTSVNVTANFTSDAACTLSSNGLFTAPDDCSPPDNVDPVAQNDQASTLQNQPVLIDILANDSDSDGSLDLSSVVITEVAANGQTSVDANGMVEYTPDTDFVGDDSFSYTVNDNQGATSNVALVNITIDAVTSVSCAVPKNLKVRALQSNSVELTWNDVAEAQYFVVEISDIYETKTLEVKHNSLDIRGLKSGITYSWRVYSSCEENRISEAGIGDPFIIPNQGAGIDLYLANSKLNLEVDRNQVHKLKMVLFDGRGRVLKRLEASKRLESQYNFNIPRQLKGQVIVIKVKTNLGRVQKKMLFSP